MLASKQQNRSMTSCSSVWWIPCRGAAEVSEAIHKLLFYRAHGPMHKNFNVRRPEGAFLSTPWRRRPRSRHMLELSLRRSLTTEDSQGIDMGCACNTDDEVDTTQSIDMDCLSSAISNWIPLRTDTEAKLLWSR